MKMEIRIRCTCGSPLTFEDTPVNGQLEHPLACTNCGADCTQKANAFIHRQLAGLNPETPETDSDSGWFSRLRRKRETETGDTTIHSKKSSRRDETVTETGEEAVLGRLALAGFAALLAGILGAIGWLYVAKATGYQIGYVAWALGGLCGWASRLVAPRGHRLLGAVATIAAFIAIGGGQYLVSRWVIHEAVHEYAPLAYEEIVAYAKEVEAAETSEDLRDRTAEYKLVEALAGRNQTNVIMAYQTYQIAESGFALLGIVSKSELPRLTFAERDKLMDTEKITTPEIARFDAQVAPVLKQLTEGQPSKALYEATLEKQIHARISISNIAANAINMYTMLWIFLGLGTAYRIACNAGLQY